MCLEDRLASVLDAEIQAQNASKEEPKEQSIDIETLINKKMSDMELRLNASIEKLIKENQKPTETVEQKGDTDGSHSELPVSEQG